VDPGQQVVGVSIQFPGAVGGLDQEFFNAGGAGEAAQAMWRPASVASFALVKILLKPLVPVTISNPARLALGTPRFAVVIAPECSGLEGMGLMLAFVIAQSFFLAKYVEDEKQ